MCRACLNVQVYVRVCVCFTCCGAAPHGEAILAGVCAVQRSVQNPGLQVSLSCSDMKTISLTADLTTAPQDKCQTWISEPRSKLDDCIRICVLLELCSKTSVLLK